MDISTTMTSMQVLLIWMLTGLLLTWMVVFALLALKPERKRKSEPDRFSSANSSFPQLHVIVQPQTRDRQIESTTASSSRVRR